MDDAARVHRAAFDERLPWLSGLHTPDEDRRLYREQVFTACEVWGVVERGRLVGVIAFHDDWIEHLYMQGREIRREALVALDLSEEGRGAALLRASRLCRRRGNRREGERGARA